MTQPTIRPATEADIPFIRAIYNDAVANTTAIWNEILVDDENRRDWWQERVDAGFPVLVASEGAIVLGYATFGPFRPHDGFRHTAELSIYVEKDQRGRGIGKLMLEALLAEASKRKIHALMAGIEASNTASIKLHEAAGFEKVGLMPEVGRKFDRWLDLLFMQKTL